jgi:outer membrane protein OmpU
MKKLLLASAATLAMTGIAAAEVKLSGNGRFGIVYEDDGTTDDTFFSYRLRFNIDASTETDTGIKFGGRIRLQYDYGDTVEDGQGAAEVNAAMLYAESAGFRFEIGNTNTAFDSLNTLYNAELGFIGTTTGSYSLFSYSAYSSGPFSAAQSDRVGLFASYTVGDLVARVSYIDYDQFSSADEEETGVSIDYSTGPFSIGLGYVSNANGNADYDVWAILGEYALNSNTNVGLQIIGEDGDNNDLTYTLYGNTELAGGIGLGAFISGVDSDATYENDFAIGIGASYDLGGATLAGTIQKGFDDETYADLGIRFSF